MQTAANHELPTRIAEPPLVPGFPVVGSVPEMIRLGLDFFVEKWRRYGDVYRVKAGTRNMVIIAHPDGVERVLGSNRDNYYKGHIYDDLRVLTGEGLLTLEQEPWRKRRRMAQPAFHKESIRNLTATMARITGEKLDEWRRRLPEGGTVDMHREMVQLTLDVVGDALFGSRLEREDTDASGRAFGEALELLSQRSNAAVQWPAWVPTPGNVRLRRAIRLLDAMVYDIIARARAGSSAAGTPTLLRMLIDARDADTGEGLVDRELRDEMITLFLAGHETTALLMSWGFTLLGREPPVVEKMRAEVREVLGQRVPTADDLPRLTYVRQVVDEILRLRSPVWSLGRDVAEDDVVAGFRVRKGDIAMPMVYLTHRHPDFWQDPERFDPERFRPEQVKARHHWAYYPFSLGPRMCIGNMFTLVEAQIIWAMLLQRIDFELPPGPPVQAVTHMTLRPKGAVNVTFRWRS